MQVLAINSIGDKTIDSALTVLKDLGYDVVKDDSLSLFNIEEAEYRIENISLDEENLEIYFKNLTDKERGDIIKEIADRYDNSDVLDYDLLDDIVRDCFKNFINNKSKGE